MKLQQLEYFLATCEHGSFSAAADALYLSQPSLAEQVRRLEEELRVKLFVRSSRKLELTEAGRSLMPHAETVIASMEAARASVVDVRELRSGIVSFGTFGLAYHYFIGALVAEFATLYPDVRIRVVGQNSIQVCEQIRSGGLEAGLVMTPVDESSLEVEAVMEEETVFVTPDASQESPVSIEEVAKSRLILYDAQYGWNDPLRRRLAERARQAGVELQPAIEVESFDAALRLAARGLGTTVAMRSITEGTWFPSPLRAVSLDPPLVDSFAFVRRRGVELSPATKQFVKLASRQVTQATARQSPLSAATSDSGPAGANR